ncbi:MAG: winged helix-turn-helix transcriptional regulator [Rubritepida sp.]|nr:winged helix-turn-helix transcriptional regulator [Rubritepida sp.]
MSFDLAAFLPYRLAVVAARVSARFAQQYAAHGVSIPQWRVLAALGSFGEAHATRLVALTTMDKVKVSRAVAGLIEAGHLRRRADAQDNRRDLLALTAKGRRLYAALVPLALRMQAELLAALPPGEAVALDAALARLGG